MYKAKYLRPQTRTGPDTILHLKLWTGTAFDYSLNNHPGTLKGTSPTFKYPGVDLPSTDEYIEVNDHDDFTPALTPFSISAWVYMHEAGNFRIISKQAGAQKEWELVLASNDILYWTMFDQDAAAKIGRYYNTALTSYENQWLHVVATYDGGVLCSAMKVYLDSVRRDDKDNSSGTFVAVENLAQNVFVGRVGASYADGLVDNVMILKKELTALDVLNIYNVQKWRYGR